MIMRPWAILAFKFLVSATFLYVAFTSIDFDVLIARLGYISSAWLLLATLPFLAQIGLQALRWRTIALPVGVNLSPGNCLRIVCIAAFFNQTLPSTIGGDAARVLLSVRAGARTGAAITSVLLDRFAGVLALLAIVAAMLPWSLGLFADPHARTGVIAVVALGFAGAGAFFVIGAGRWSRLGGFRPVAGLLDLSRCGSRLLLRWSPGAPVFGLSLAIQALTLIGAFLLARAMALEVGFVVVAALMPLVMLVSIVPISIAGWGVREGAMITAFGFVGMAPADALAFSVLFGAILLAVGAVGGIVWLAGDMRRRTGAENIDAGATTG
jgi:uncharacterized membrane protein YbhN (UPF0104 family)